MLPNLLTDGSAGRLCTLLHFIAVVLDDACEAEVTDLDNMVVVADENIASRQVSMDVVLLLDIAHPVSHLHNHSTYTQLYIQIEGLGL